MKKYDDHVISRLVKILNQFQDDVVDFLEGGDQWEYRGLYFALYDLMCGEQLLDYATAKAREGDPYAEAGEFLQDFFDQEINMESDFDYIELMFKGKIKWQKYKKKCSR